jgi:COP9 signalosome complex subunit 3
MEKIVDRITSYSGSEEGLRNLKLLLSKEEGYLIKNINYIDDILNNILDPKKTSLGYIYLLAAKTSSQKLDPGQYFSQFLKLVQNGSPQQVRMAAAKFREVCKRFTEMMVEGNRAIVAIRPLKLAVSLVRENSSSLTPVHAMLLQACLAAKCYNGALQTLEEEICEINQERSGCTARDVLMYYYYGGMLYTGLKNYKTALSFFKMVICTPAVVMSAIMNEGYKKFVLVSLLVHGKLALPRGASSVIQRQSKNYPLYAELAKLYSENDVEKFQKLVDENQEIFKKEKNFGLVKQCVQALYRRNIQRLTQTYLTFSLKDMATSVKLPSAKEAEMAVLGMIEKGEIFASINHKDGTVSFHEDPELYDNNKTLAIIDTQIQSIIDLSNKVRNLDETISAMPTYIQRTLHERAGSSRMQI